MTSHRYYPHIGGTEKIVKYYADYFASVGNEISVYSSQRDLKDLKKSANITYYGIHLKNFGKFRFPERSYKRLIKRADIDILHVHGQRVWSSDYLYFTLDKIHAKKVFTAHGFYQMQFGGFPNKIYYGSFMPRFLKKFDGIICLTEDEKDIVLKMGIDESKALLIQDPVDFKELEEVREYDPSEKYFLEDKFVLTYVGGFYRNKNIEFLVNAIKGIDNAVLVIIGSVYDEKYKDEIVGLAKNVGVEIKILGDIERTDLINLLRLSDRFLFASTFEGFGLSLVEAAYIGIPIISTDVGIASKLEEFGFATLVNNPDEMRDQILSFKTPSKNKQPLRNLFGAEKVSKKHLELYEELIKR